jgi:phage-related protein
MRKFFVSERGLVVVLFVAVLVTFSLAHNYSKEIEDAYIGVNIGVAKGFYLTQTTVKENKVDFATFKSPAVKK